MVTRFVFIVLVFVCHFVDAQQFIPFSHSRLSYCGRIDVNKPEAAEIYWPGSSVTIQFQGTEIKAALRTKKGNAFFFVIVDGDESKAFKINPDTVRRTYTIASGLAVGKHSVQLFKLTDNTTINWFYGFELNDKAKVLKPAAPPKRKIEFYGNSITAGHGVDVPIGEKDSGAPSFFNNYYSYAARTARHYNAQYSCIARSGIGLMISWFPKIMPEIYDRVNPNDQTSKWDFSKYEPDIVVINLGQNDQWLVTQTEHEQFKARFGTVPPDEKFIIQSYINFIKSIRSKYPLASIICALGSMGATQPGSLWPGYVRQAVKESSDQKVFSHFFSYKNTPGHPKANEQKVMADELIDFIDKNIKW